MLSTPSEGVHMEGTPGFSSPIFLYGGETMEAVEPIVTAISTVGFPIVACCGLFWFANKLIDKITTVITENTLALKELSTLLKEPEKEE